ncbi:MAG: IS200/IS605 family transposase [Nitrospinota bacterium]
MGTLRRSRHNVYQIHYHFVTPIKYRKGIFEKPGREQALRTIIKGLEERYEMWFEQVGIDQNHVHWLLSAAPKYSPSELIRTIKSISAREMFKLCPDLREELWGGELWGDGFYVATVGEGGSRDVILKYVAGQGKKERSEAGQLRLFKP